MNIIIPASGIGKRFIDAGYKETKPLIDVTANKKIIDYVIDSFDRKNDTYFFITSSNTFDVMQDYLEKANIKFFHYLSNGNKNGPVGAISDVYEEMLLNMHSEDPVIISYCDFGVEWDYNEFLNYVKNPEIDGMIPCYSGYHPHLEHKENVYAAVKTINERVYAIKEKYDSSNRQEESWSPGIYYFKTSNLMKLAFDAVMENEDTVNDEYYVSLAYNYITVDFNITSLDCVEKFYQFGTPRDFEYAKDKINIVENLKNKSSNIKNTIILSAGKGERFLNVGYSHPKPFIPLNRTDFITNIEKTFKDVNTTIKYIGSDAHQSYWAKRNVNLIKSNKIGAAYSYKEGCSDITGETLIIPCDLIASHINDEFLKLKEEADLIVFTADPSEYANDNKKSFAWVGSKENNDISDISIKEAKENNDMVLIGSFWVKENKQLLEAIDNIFEEEFKVNDEYYLDNAFKYLLESGANIKYIKLNNYLSFGTPSEYFENKYWYEA